MEWSEQAELLVEIVPHVDADHRLTVLGMDVFGGAAARIVPVGSEAPTGPFIRLRPLTPPPGPFDLRGILYITPFLEVPGSRPRLIEFERRIGRRYYEYMAPARFRYAAACDVVVSGLPIVATCAEVYSIDAGSRAEAEALNESTSPEPPDVVEFYRECSALKVRGSGREIWLIPSRELAAITAHLEEP